VIFSSVRLGKASSGVEIFALLSKLCGDVMRFLKSSTDGFLFSSAVDLVADLFADKKTVLVTLIRNVDV
jgi:hypothetical protein